MKYASMSVVLALSMALILGVSGCGKKADETKPMDQVKSEAEKMDVSQLHDTAMKYKEAITAKVEEVKAEVLETISAELGQGGIA
jgi:hypothetical protein